MNRVRVILGSFREPLHCVAVSLPPPKSRLFSKRASPALNLGPLQLVSRLLLGHVASVLGEKLGAIAPPLRISCQTGRCIVSAATAHLSFAHYQTSSETDSRADSARTSVSLALRLRAFRQLRAFRNCSALPQEFPLARFRRRCGISSKIKSGHSY
jgi:hypothetical protein